MPEKPIPQFEINAEVDKILDAPTSHLRQEFEDLEKLFEAQPALVQRFLETQARSLADMIIQNSPQARFTLPDRTVIEPSESGKGRLIPVSAEHREQMAGGLLNRLARTDLRLALRQRLAELEQSTSRAVVVSARLIRYTTAVHMVHQMLPAGRSISYQTADGEEIPTIPSAKKLEAGSAITASTDAIVEEGGKESGRGELQVPYVPYARRFYLPQWVAFDDQGNMLVGSMNEAQAHIASMQRYVDILHFAAALAPYMIVDKEYQRKRYGILGQLINQGRAMAFYQTGEIIHTIKRRAAAHDLNRGLSLSLPFFDDQDLMMKTRDFTVIPSGRIMFVPAFVVRATREEEVKIAQDTRLSHSTRKYLLSELKMLEKAFDAEAAQG